MCRLMKLEEVKAANLKDEVEFIAEIVEVKTGRGNGPKVKVTLKDKTGQVVANDWNDPNGSPQPAVGQFMKIVGEKAKDYRDTANVTIKRFSIMTKSEAVESFKRSTSSEPTQQQPTQQQPTQQQPTQQQPTQQQPTQQQVATTSGSEKSEEAYCEVLDAVTRQKHPGRDVALAILSNKQLCDFLIGKNFFKVFLTQVKNVELNDISYDAILIYSIAKQLNLQNEVAYFLGKHTSDLGKEHLPAIRIFCKLFEEFSRISHSLKLLQKEHSIENIVEFL